MTCVGAVTSLAVADIVFWSALHLLLNAGLCGASAEYYTDQYAVEIRNGNESYAKEIARRHGFTYVTTVSELLLVL